MGKGKTMLSYPWLTVYATMHYGDVPYNENAEEEDKESITLPSMHNQEILLIKKDLILKLSKEAKEVINLILCGPSEVLETFLTPKYHQVSKEKIKQYLIKDGWPKKTVRIVFEELKRFVMDIETTQ